MGRIQEILNSPPPCFDNGGGYRRGWLHLSSFRSRHRKGLIGGVALARSRELRRNLTSAEHLLWMKLRRKAIGGVNFRRQHPLYGFIVDFCCPERKLIIELDGADHAEPDSVNYDARRTALLESKGYRVLRFWNPDVLENLEGVLEEIYGAVKKTAPPP